MGFLIFATMKNILLLSTGILLASCGSNSYTCVCTDKGNNDKEVATITIEADKETSASFECQQKNLQYASGELFKDVQCKLEK